DPVIGLVPGPRPQRHRGPQRRVRPAQDAEPEHRGQEAQRMHGPGHQPDRPEPEDGPGGPSRLPHGADRLGPKDLPPESGAASRPSEVSRPRWSVPSSAGIGARNRRSITANSAVTSRRKTLTSARAWPGAGPAPVASLRKSDGTRLASQAVPGPGPYPW